MRYGSVCSGIEAATKVCAKCGESKPIGEFHKQPTGKMGRHSYCKPCYNERNKTRNRSDTPEQKRQWNLSRRYGITVAEFDEMLARQGGKCVICEQEPKRPVVDHCHETGAVRGILCHRCNIILHGIENADYRGRAMRYLGLVK